MGRRGRKILGRILELILKESVKILSSGGCGRKKRKKGRKEERKKMKGGGRGGGGRNSSKKHPSRILEHEANMENLTIISYKSLGIP